MAKAGEADAPIDSAELAGDVWSVAKLNAEIETVLQEARDRFPRYVVGEVADINAYSFGTFFELSDIEEDAVITCLAWSSNREAFEHELADGTAAVLQAHPDYYGERGDMRLLVEEYWPIGESYRARALEELRNELEAEGLLDGDRKQPLPTFPRCVGVVTSPSGSAREDFSTTIHDRFPSTSIKMCGASVQGDAAVPSLVGGIQRLERDPHVDVLVVTRGGGSDTDLWCFDREPVVRAIAACRTPVVVAIGHEDDETLAEAVADERAMTPTDAGVATTPDSTMVRESLAQLETRIDTTYRRLVADRLTALDRHIASGYTTLEQHVAAELATLQRAADLEQRITLAYGTLVTALLTTLDQRLDAALTDVQHAAETDAVTARAARARIGDLEARIDQAYRTLRTDALTAIETRIQTAYTDVERSVAARSATLRRAADLERRISVAYRSVVVDTLGTLDRRLDSAVQEQRHTAAARSRIRALEARIEQSYRSRVQRELTEFEVRIESAYRDVERDAKVTAGTAEARRLRLVVAVLVALLVIGGILVLMGVL